jgi:hypothetical protein
LNFYVYDDDGDVEAELMALTAVKSPSRPKQGVVLQK